MISGFALRGVGAAHRGVAVLHDVSFEIPPGARMAVVGPSGAGKSTLLRLLAGLEAPSSGQILLDGSAASRPGEIIVAAQQRCVSMVFQDSALWPNLSAPDNVTLALSGGGLNREARRHRAAAALELVGIAALAHRRPDTLSGGEQQRVALARAVAASPRYLLLDEPFASIDLPAKLRLQTELLHLAEQQRIALVLVTHDPLEAAALCADALILEAGRVTARGRWPDLLAAERRESPMLAAFRAQLASVGRLPHG